MQKSLREDLALRGYDLVFEYKGSTIAVNTKEFTSEKEEAVYQKYGLKALRWDKGITLYNPEVWKVVGTCGLTLVEDCLAPEQPFFAVAPQFTINGVKDLSHWDVASATDFSWMFSRCNSLKELILDGWDVSSVKDMSYMFALCESLESLSLDGWDVSVVKDLYSMFYKCAYLETLSLDGWDVSGVKDMRLMFFDCRSLKNLSLDGWCISEDARTDDIFEGCPVSVSIESLKGVATPCSVF